MSTPQKPQQQPLRAPQAPLKPQQPVAQAPKPAPAPVKKQFKSFAPQKQFTLLFDRDNYILMALGVALIFFGFMLMSGGKSPDPHKFNYDEIFSFRRITLAPIVVLLGFTVEVFAIMKKPKETEVEGPGTPAGSAM